MKQDGDGTEEGEKTEEDITEKTEDDKHLRDIDVKSKYCFRLLCEYDQVGRFPSLCFAEVSAAMI